MNRGNVNKETARQSDVAGDAGTLFAEGFLGDLDDDILSSLQHFGDELRATRRTRPASLITTVRPWAAGAAFETRTTAGTSAAIGATATAVGASTAAIGASATAIAATVASTATEGPLKARARIAAHTSGVPREIFARSRWTANARRASFARQENRVIFDDRRAFNDGFASGSGDQFFFSMFVSCVFILNVFMVDMFVLVVLMLTVSGMMFGMFLGHVRGEFGPVGSAAGFDFRSFFFGEFRNLGNCCFLSFFRFFCLFL